MKNSRRDFIRSTMALSVAAAVPGWAISAESDVCSDAREKYGDGISVLNIFKQTCVVSLSYIPEVGPILSGLVSFLWPTQSSGPDVWDTIRCEVEAEIRREIDDAVFSVVKQILVGAGDVLKDYLSVVKSQDGRAILDTFISTNVTFLQNSSQFQNEEFEWVLAPLAGLFFQLHALLLRNANMNAKKWGWPRSYRQILLKDSSRHIASYIKYLNKIGKNEKTRLMKGAPSSAGQHKTEIYNYWADFNRCKILYVDDFALTISHTDPKNFPGPTKDLSEKFSDVFSLAYGTADDWDGACSNFSSYISTPYSKPIRNISKIEFYHDGGDASFPNDIKIHYPAGSGPILWGNQYGSRSDVISVIQDGDFVENEPSVEYAAITVPPIQGERKFNVEKANLRVGTAVQQIGLILEDGTHLDCPPTGGDAPWQEISVPGRMLSTITMWTRSHYFSSAPGAVVFGFSFDSIKSPPDVIKELIYIGYMTAPNLGPTYLPQSVSLDLQQRRNQFWYSIDARARR